jgi:hypothetical protein
MLDPRVPCFDFTRTSRVWRKSLVVVLFAAVLLPASAVHAATVAIVRPSRSSPAWDETVSRLHGELLSVGAEVQMVDGTARAKSTDARAWFLELATQRGLDAIIDIVGDASPVTVEVWVKGKAPGQFEVSRVDLEPGGENASERSAIRALEVLRSIFLEIDLASRARKTEVVAPPPHTPAPKRLDLELGAAGMTGLDGVGLSLLPMARVGWALRPWFAVQAALAGLGTRSTVTTTAGSADVTQDFGMLGGCFRWRAGHRVQPLLALSMGWLRTSVSGKDDAPKVGHSDHRWALLGDASVGTALRMVGHAYATLAAHIQWSAPSTTIHFLDKIVASTGRPNLMLSLTLGAWL